MKVLQEKFGQLDDQMITAYTLVNGNGMKVSSINYGCIITEILAADRHGCVENVILGFDRIEEYVQHSPYFGAVVGRFAGRIKNAKFELDNKTYRLAKNNNGNHLHGGMKGFDKAIWKAEIKEKKESASVVYSYLSPDGEEGYPGNVEMQVTYTLNNQNELLISYKAASDQKTLLNVTNHSYFNLSGDLKRDILDHELTIKSNQFAELDQELIPTGELLSVQNTPFDFNGGRKIKDGTVSVHPQNLLAGKGYDHPFLLSENNNREIVLYDKESGRMLEIETTQPAVVLYTGTQLTGDYNIRGTSPRKYLGLCLETQGMPDSIHHPHFPSSIIEKNEFWESVTKYRFKVPGTTRILSNFKF